MRVNLQYNGQSLVLCSTRILIGLNVFGCHGQLLDMDLFEIPFPVLQTCLNYPNHALTNWACNSVAMCLDVQDSHVQMTL